MNFTLTGLPSQFNLEEGLLPIKLGEVIICASGDELRALAAHILLAAAAIDAGKRTFDSFTFRDAMPPRNTPSQIMFQSSQRT